MGKITNYEQYKLPVKYEVLTVIETDRQEMDVKIFHKKIGDLKYTLNFSGLIYIFDTKGETGVRFVGSHKFDVNVDEDKAFGNEGEKFSEEMKESLFPVVEKMLYTLYASIDEQVRVLQPALIQNKAYSKFADSEIKDFINNAGISRPTQEI